MACPSVANDCGRHNSYGPRPGYQNVFTQNWKAESRVDSVSKWIENGCYVAIDIRSMVPDIGHGKSQVFREGSRAINANTLCIRAKVTPPCHTVATSSADYMTLSANQVPWLEIADIAANGDDFTNELVSYNHGYRYGVLGPGIPFIDVQIRSTDTGAINFNEHVIDTDFRLWNIFQSETSAGRLFGQSLHRWALCFA